MQRCHMSVEHCIFSIEVFQMVYDLTDRFLDFTKNTLKWDQTSPGTVPVVPLTLSISLKYISNQIKRE